MSLAAIEGGVLIALAMAFFGFLSWLLNKLKPAEPKPPQPLDPHTDRPAATLRARADSEEERMRRFLEALGLPADSPAAPRRPAPTPRAEQRPVPPIVATPPQLPSVPRPARRAAAPPPPLPPPPAVRPRDEPAPARRLEEIETREIAVAKLPDFETVSSRIHAIPGEVFASQDEAARVAGPTLHETLHAALASPQQLRAAFVLREVLGPPPGLRAL